jgi:hypothetical protein
VVGVNEAGAILRLPEALSCDEREASIYFFRMIRIQFMSRYVSAQLTVTNVILV